MSKDIQKKPELLSPAGSSEALDAAIAGGADAVYFGASAFNARMFAANFTREEIRRAISKCRNYGVRSNITFNTLIYDKEFDAALDEIEFLYKCGADALIIADLGLACEVKRRFPDIELHASTQMSVHNVEYARFLAKEGFKRAVLARELDRDMIKYVCEKSPIESEVFIHGALCVSNSGQCLFSSLVGARSGNRGECAQPCRLPYNGKYPLSLKDNCLAGNFKELLSFSPASLKIEGRMKSPSYVYGVTSIYRRLIDENRDATDDEIRKLTALFSRSGFTNGYYTRKITSDMNGVRTENDKALTNEAEQNSGDISARKRRLILKASLKAEKEASLTLMLPKEEVSVTVYGPVPEAAQKAELTRESFAKNLRKFGSSDFALYENMIGIDIDPGLILPVSSINALRRDAVSALEEKLIPKREINVSNYEKRVETVPYDLVRSAVFAEASQISDAAKDYFEVRYLPLEKFDASAANGVILPPAIFDRERESVTKMLENARKAGAVHALAGNIGHIELAYDLGFICHGDFRLNVTNPESAKALFEKTPLVDLIPSPELTLVKIREFEDRVRSNTIVYGRIPLMTLEKCAIGDIVGCERCKSGKVVLKDRRGEEFPIMRVFEHRNVIYNSRVTYMADKYDELCKCGIEKGHFIFTVESAKEVSHIIEMYKKNLPADFEMRRVKYS